MLNVSRVSLLRDVYVKWRKKSMMNNKLADTHPNDRVKPMVRIQKERDRSVELNPEAKNK